MHSRYHPQRTTLVTELKRNIAAMSYSTAQPFDASQWRPVDGFDFTDITYHRHAGAGRVNGIVRIAFDLSLIHI